MTRNISLQLLSLGLPPLHQRYRVPNLSLHAMMLRSKLQVILGVAPAGGLPAGLTVYRQPPCYDCGRSTEELDLVLTETRISNTLKSF